MSAEGPRKSAPPTILLVEDDPRVQTALVRAMTGPGYTVKAVGTAAAALREAAGNTIDLIVLDLGLPDLDGAAALRMIRGISSVPIIIASARREEQSVVKLLNDGADDYVIKPFSSVQLIARMRALLRRTALETPETVHQIGELRIAVGERAVSFRGLPLTLTRKEFDLLAYLAEQPGQVVPRKSILAHVWNGHQGSDQSLAVHVSWLRRKLGESAAEPRYLHTVHGVGLKLAAPT